MDPLTSSTMAGSGTFRCEQCGHVVAAGDPGALGDCPSCGARKFTRASLFGGERFAHREGGPESAALRAEWLELTRAGIEGEGRFLAYEDGERTVVVPLEHEWTRIGRSLAADVRFDDATVSRRHALIVRQDDGVRVLDDRSLNGVFVNGHRIEWSALSDGDEIVVGRYKLCYLEVAPVTAQGPAAASASV